MRKTTLLIAIALITFVTACIPERNNVTPNPGQNSSGTQQPPPNQPIDSPNTPNDGISIVGFKDIDITSYAKKEMSLNIRCDSCNANELFLSISGGSNNLKTVFTKESGYSDFNTQLKLEANFPKPGVHPIEIVATDRQGKKNTFKKNITVKQPTRDECNKAFRQATASFFHSSLKTSGGANVDTVLPQTFIQVLEKGDGNLYFKKIPLLWTNTASSRYISYQGGIDFHVRFSVDCDNGNIIIPEQIIQGRSWGDTQYFNVKGSGKINFDTKHYEITYTSILYNGSTAISTQEFKLFTILRNR